MAISQAAVEEIENADEVSFRKQHHSIAVIELFCFYASPWMSLPRRKPPAESTIADQCVTSLLLLSCEKKRLRVRVVGALSC